MVAGLLGSALILPASTFGATYDPGSDPYSMAAIADATGANDWWNAGYTGQGVDVAVIDTGVGRVPGFGGERQGRLRPRPLARVAGAEPAKPRHQRPRNVHGRTDRRQERRSGVQAPRINPGSPGRSHPFREGRRRRRRTDVSQVIAAIDWVVEHRHDSDMNIRVISLSYGTNSTQVHGRSARLRGRTGLEEGHRGRGGCRQQRASRRATTRLASPSRPTTPTSSRSVRRTRMAPSRPRRRRRRLVFRRGRRSGRARSRTSSRPGVAHPGPSGPELRGSM